MQGDGGCRAMPMVIVATTRLAKLPRGREKFIAHLPHGFHIQFLAVEDDLAALLVLPCLEVARHVHPANRLPGAHFVCLADDEVNIHRLAHPVFEMAVIRHIEDFAAVALAVAQVRVAALELDIDALAAGFAVVVFEFDFAINAVIEHRHGPKYLIGFARDGHHVADEDLFERLRVEFARSRFFHLQNPLRHRIALEPLFDEIFQRHALVASLTKDEVFFLSDALAHGFEVFHRLAAVGANVAAVARDFASVLGEMAVSVFDKDRLQLVLYFSPVSPMVNN